MLAAVEGEMLPARSDLVAPLIASRACVGSLIGKRLPLAANCEAGMDLRLPAVRFAIGIILVIGHGKDNGSPAVLPASAVSIP